MKPVKADDIPEYRDLMSDIWEFIKNFVVPEKGNEYRNQLWMASREIVEKYRGNDVAEHMILGLTMDFQVRWEEENGRRVKKQ